MSLRLNWLRAIPTLTLNATQHAATAALSYELTRGRWPLWPVRPGCAEIILNPMRLLRQFFDCWGRREHGRRAK